MADPDAPWAFDDTPEEAPAETPATEGPAEPALATDGVPGEEYPPPPEELTEAQKRKKFICRHWIRPTNLQYKYIYNYRKNYYDDVIDYLDKRNKGLTSDQPRAQTWAERALRTYNREIDRTGEYIRSFGIRLHPLEVAGRKKYVNPYHAEHSHDYYHRKYYTALYHCVV